MVFALAVNAAPSLADAPTLGQKVDAMNSAIAKANSKEKPVLQAVLRDMLDHASATQFSASPALTITKTEARADVLVAYLMGERDSSQSNMGLVNAYALTAQNAANAAGDCRKATQVVTSTSSASACIENSHHMHIAQGFVALLPVLFMMFHKYQACDQPIVVPKPAATTKPSIAGITTIDDLLNQLNLPKQP